MMIDDDRRLKILNMSVPVSLAVGCRFKILQEHASCFLKMSQASPELRNLANMSQARHQM